MNNDYSEDQSRTLLKLPSSAFASNFILEASCGIVLIFRNSRTIAGTQVLEIIAGLHSGRHWIRSSAVIAEKGLPILWTEDVKADCMFDLAGIFFDEKLFNMSISVAVPVEQVDRPGVEHIVEDESVEQLRVKVCLAGVTGGSVWGNPCDGNRSEPGNSTGCNSSLCSDESGSEEPTQGDRPAKL